MGNKDSRQIISYQKVSSQDRIIVYTHEGARYLVAQEDGSYKFNYRDVVVTYKGDVQEFEGESFADGVGVMHANGRKWIGLFEKGRVRRCYSIGKQSIWKGRFTSDLRPIGKNFISMCGEKQYVSDHVYVNGKIVSRRKIYNREGYLEKSGVYVNTTPLGLIESWEMDLSKEGQLSVHRFEEIFENGTMRNRKLAQTLTFEQYKELSFKDSQKYRDWTEDQYLEEFKQSKN